MKTLNGTMRMINSRLKMKNVVKLFVPCIIIVILMVGMLEHYRFACADSEELCFRYDVKDTKQFQTMKCINGDITLDNFHSVLNRLSKTKISACRSAFNLFSAMFYLRKSPAEVILTDTFSKTVLRWFNNDTSLVEKAKNQFVLVIMNKYTNDGTLINPLRNKRPGFGGGPHVDKYVHDIVQKSKENCDFCNYKSKTGRDLLGVLKSKHSLTIANTFKIERFHSLVLWRHHNPLEFNEEQFLDLMGLAQTWFRKSHELDKSFAFPTLLWDILPKASASQLHPHAHILLSKDHYFSGWEKIFRAASDYQKKENRNYFNDLVKIHNSFGLTITRGNAVAFVSMTPSVSHEVIIFSENVGDDIFKLFYRMMKAFMKLKMYAISVGAVFPPMDSNLKYNNMKVPCMIRMVNRGAADEVRSDISSMELFGSGNINVDFWKFREQLAASLED